ncbi:hypothetical protein SAMN02982929_06939 [Saccharopolyspora kobensis]|uniref:Uncharacterized protein n=1 Tax=Saccharopolyspora kobensis TaxID=146035 RepID=A0A1H6EKR8_9PSEU|nr:hypothetical protein [Saccharopolyspora kobensis]SEG97943.1 hypothetical protein SAMN02982929_06939 [Saccharopolyspora kobensis]SFF23416.1 hypothetical protein SAMN05216506_1233 [Saccharopolyspora kobensis]
MNDPTPPQRTAAVSVPDAQPTFFHPATGAALIQAGTSFGNHTFHIRPDELPRVLAGLDKVRDAYVVAQDRATMLAQVVPPFADEVTMNAVARIRERARGGEGSLYDTARGLMDWVDEFKKAVQKAIVDHQRIDEENKPG